MTHTPGPWKVSPGHSPASYTVRADAEVAKPVAEIWHNGDDIEANARLIAASPQMREACRAIIAAHEAMFIQCASNPVTNAWGQQVNLTELNEAARLAGIALAAAKPRS